MEYGASAEDVARVCHAHPVCHMKFIDTSCDAVVCLRQTQKPSGKLASWLTVEMPSTIRHHCISSTCYYIVNVSTEVTS